MVALAADPGSFDRLSQVLAGGGVAIVPCDTMYGIVGVAPGTEGRIRDIKGRGEKKPLLQLIARASWITQMSDQPAPPVLSRYWPGPLTLVFPARGGGTVALRLPDSPFLLRLMERVGQPLYSTSVNRAGRNPIVDVAAMTLEFESEVDLIFDAGDLQPGPPSTLIDITSRPYRVLRQGAVKVPAEELA